MADVRRRAADHGRHDLELVARVVAGDGSASDVRTAEAQVAGCDECAGLEVDLRAIAAATRALGPSSAPARAPRDFRITAADAARLRPRGFRGLLQDIGFRRGLVPAGVGSGLLAIGFVGLLVGAGIFSTTIGPGARGAAPAQASTAEALAAGATSAGASPAGTSPARATDDRASSQSFAAVLAPGQSRAPVQSTSSGGTGGDLAGPKATPVEAPLPARRNDALILLSAAVVAFGLALLLAARSGTRRSP